MPSNKVSFPISFRADNTLLTHLEKGAARYGISVHEYARLRLVEMFERQDEARVLAEIKATRGSIEDLQSAIAATLEVTLLNTTNSPPEQIRGWIDTHLRQSGGE